MEILELKRGILRCFLKVIPEGLVLYEICVQSYFELYNFTPTALKGCWGIIFIHGVWIGRRAAGSLSGLYLKNRKV